MAEQPLNLAIPRLKANEDRVNTFVNGSDTTDMQPATGAPVPSIRKIAKKIIDDNTALVADKVVELDDALTGFGTASTALLTAKTTAFDSVISNLNAEVVDFLGLKNDQINTAADGILAASRGARDKAEAWANAPKGTEVEAGKHSARHFAETAADIVEGVGDQVTLVNTKAEEASNSATQAEESAAEAAGAAAISKRLVEAHFTNNHAVLASDAGKVLAFEKSTPVVATLPLLATLIDDRFIFLNTGVGVLTVQPNGADTIPGYTPLKLVTGAMAELWISADGGTWRAKTFEPSNGDEWVYFPRSILAGGASWSKNGLAGFRDLVIEGYARSSAEPASFALTFSRDDGANFDEVANYSFHRLYGLEGAANAVSDGDLSDPGINIGITGSIGALAGEGVHFEIRVFNLTENLARVSFRSTTFNTSGQYFVQTGGGLHGGTGGARNAVRLKFSAGNMADGYVLIKGLK